MFRHIVTLSLERFSHLRCSVAFNYSQIFIHVVSQSLQIVHEYVSKLTFSVIQRTIIEKNVYWKESPKRKRMRMLDALKNSQGYREPKDSAERHGVCDSLLQYLPVDSCTEGRGSFF